MVEHMAGYTRRMGRIQTLVQLTDELVALLDAEAAARGVSRSALIREILTEHTAAHREELVDRRIIEGYQQTPPARPDAWGELGDVTDQATADLLQRLDEEERRHGHPSW
jgi:hypothetical protein